MTVVIVLNPAYPELEQLAEQVPIWAVNSTFNRAIAERSWRLRGTADAFQGKTLFRVADEGDAEGNFANVIGDVDMHHGISGARIAILRVIGTQPSNRLRERLKEYGFVKFEQMSRICSSHAIAQNNRVR